MRETATPLLGRNAQPHVCAHYHVTSSATAWVAVCELATRRAVRAPPSAPRAPPPARRASYAEKPCTFQLDDVAEKKKNSSALIVAAATLPWRVEPASGAAATARSPSPLVPISTSARLAA